MADSIYLADGTTILQTLTRYKLVMQNGMVVHMSVTEVVTKLWDLLTSNHWRNEIRKQAFKEAAVFYETNVPRLADPSLNDGERYKFVPRELELMGSEQATADAIRKLGDE